ncbi:MAG: acyl-CoA thioesterase, partial [Bacteroidaceae bacterium]|nr:acyl-CoA thioesterase [Bacteroidaceae bacterium]
EAAKIVLDYEITNPENGDLLATGHTVQVFMDLDYQLVLTNPEFFENWKRKWNV